jgi:YVTN family beta-propeller protein
VVAFACRVEAAPFAWLAHYSVDRVARVDLATHETASVAVGSSPISTAASLDGRRAYSNNGTDQTVSVIDAPTMTVIATVPMPAFPSAVAARPDGAKAYVPLGDGTIVVIDDATNTITATMSAGSFPNFGAIVMNAAGTRAYLTMSEFPQTSVVVIDTVNDAIVADVLLNIDNTFPLGVAVSSDGTRVYATAFGAMEVYVVDATTNLLVDTIPLSTEFGEMQPTGLAVSPDGTRVYVTAQFTNRLHVLDAVGLAEVGSIPVGNGPFVVDLTPDGSRAYVVNTSGSSMTIVDVATDTVVGTVLTVDEFPTGGERFIAPGTTTTTTSTTLGASTTLAATTSTSTSTSTTSSSSAASTTSTSSTTSSTTVPPPPALSAAALVCQKTLALSFKRFGAKVHGVFVTCFQRLLAEVANGHGTADAGADCVADLDGGLTSAKVTKLRNVARAAILARCASVGPAVLAHPCDPGATTMVETADCVLDAQLVRVAQAIAAEYGASCSIATAAGLTPLYPELCPAP